MGKSNTISQVSELDQVLDKLSPILSDTTRADLAKILVRSARESSIVESKQSRQELLHAERWFRLRLIMGYTCIAMLGFILVFSTLILVMHDRFPDSVVTGASHALLVDILGITASLYRIVLSAKRTGGH